MCVVSVCMVCWCVRGSVCTYIHLLMPIQRSVPACICVERDVDRGV